jgi:hypothetical protein
MASWDGAPLSSSEINVFIEGRFDPNLLTEENRELRSSCGQV